MTVARRRPFLMDVYEENLDEAAFLWRAWEAARVSATQTPADVAAGPEERLRAHLDELVLGGKEVAVNLLVPALGGDEIDRVAPATWALLEAEDADHLEDVLAVFQN